MFFFILFISIYILIHNALLGQPNGCTLFCAMFHHFKTNGFVFCFSYSRDYKLDAAFTSNVLLILYIIHLVMNKDWFVESGYFELGCQIFSSYSNFTLKGCIQHICHTWQNTVLLLTISPIIADFAVPSQYIFAVLTTLFLFASSFYPQ